MFTYIRSLLIEKDGRVRQNISIKFLCVFVCLSYSVLLNFTYFVLFVLRYFPFHADFVLIRYDLFPPLQWRSGRIIKLFPRVDGDVRVVSVKSSRGEFKKSMYKLAKLLIADDVSSLS